MTNTFNLERLDGRPAQPPTLKTAVPNWQADDTIPPGPGRMLRVRLRDDDADQPPMPGR
jgi:hypothetical protein